MPVEDEFPCTSVCKKRAFAVTALDMPQLDDGVVE
jgi:hypothetical protein